MGNRRVGLSLLLISLSVMITLGVILFAQQQRAVKRLVSQSFAVSAEEAAQYNAIAVKVSDVISIHRSLARSFVATHSDFVVVRDASGNVLFAIPDDQKNNESLQSTISDVRKRCAHTYAAHKILFNSEEVGTLEYCYDLNAQAKIDFPIYYYFLLTLVASAIWLILNFWFRRQTRGVQLFLTAIDSIDVQSPNLTPLQKLNLDPELRTLHGKLNRLIEELIKAADERKSAERDAIVAEVSRQVAHDIRSPLSALNMLIKDTRDLPEEKRHLLKLVAGRIQGIAATLTERTLPNQRELGAKFTSVHCSSVIEHIVAEKRQEFSQNESAQITFGTDDQTYGMFAYAETEALKRVISNLVSNAVESLVNRRGQIDCSLGKSGEWIEIRVKDDGAGIPAEILPRLKTRGQTFNKPGGNGLGLYSAEQTLKLWGGSLTIESKVGQGTEVLIRLKPSEKPHWFLEKIVLGRDALVVAVDDDPSMLSLWKNRFVVSGLIKPELFNAFSSLDEYSKEAGSSTTRTHLFIDYEFRGSTKTGLDFVEQNTLKTEVVLVTSHYEEPLLIKRAEALGIRMIPKDQAAFVPVVVQDTEEG